MKNLRTITVALDIVLLVVLLTVVAGMSSCSVDQLRESLGFARQEAAAIRADAEAVAESEGPDSEAAKKMAELVGQAESHVAAIEAKIASAQTWEAVVLALLEYGLAPTGVGGIAAIAIAAWRRNRNRLNAVVGGLETAKVEATNAPGAFVVDKAKMRAALADAGVLASIEAMREKIEKKKESTPS